MKVRYNGERATYYSCSEPEKLIEGNVYEVIRSRDLGFQTNYLIEYDEGQYGEFNSMWFEKVMEENVYIAFSTQIPIIGKRFNCFVHYGVFQYEVFTTTVNDVEYLGNSIYKVNTRNSIYYVEVG